MKKKFLPLIVAALVGGTLVAVAQIRVRIDEKYYLKWVKVTWTDQSYRHIAYIHPDYAGLFGVTNLQTLTEEEFRNMQNPIRVEHSWSIQR